LASPLAGAFLLLAAVAWASTGRWRAALPLAGAVVGVGLAGLAGGGGTFPLSLVTLLPVVLLVVAGLWVVPKPYLALRRGLLLYGVVAVVLAVIPTPVGGNVTRLGALVGGPLAVAVLWRLRKWLWLGLVAVPLLAWPAVPAIAAVAYNSADPSRHAAYFANLNQFLTAHRAPYGRVEVPMMREHWEAAYVASKFPLARGWERQIDRRYNKLFYDKDDLTVSSYEKWLHDNAVRYVALPDAPIDFAGTAEVKLLRSGAVHELRPVWSDAHWQVWEVRHPTPLVSGAGSLAKLDVDSFTLQFAQPGTSVVRLHASTMWRSADPAVCIDQTSDGWTTVSSEHSGQVTVNARPSLAALRGPDCPRH
jgi:hypothetical protein